MGHGVAAIRFDMIRRYLEFCEYSVEFVQNVTNVDDKIIRRSQELSSSAISLSEKFTKEYNQLVEELGVKPADKSPDVITYIPKIVSYIKKIIASGFAYSTTSGNVYFSISKSRDYGKLSGQSTEDLRSGVRKTAEEDKRDPLDFALWKNDNHPEMSWDSPWGRGRPGWHIECSTMANALLGPRIDIHCGGLDLIFPHHENEIAQCEAHNGSKFANYWIHSGLLTVDGEKMSKSTGKFVTLSDAIGRYGAELIRYVILRHQYRSNVNLSTQLFEESLNQCRRLIMSLDSVELTTNETRVLRFNHLKEDAERKAFLEFEHAMENDFNTPNAITQLQELISIAEATRDTNRKTNVLKATLLLARSIGLMCSAQPTQQIHSWVKNHSLNFTTEGLSLDELEIKLEERTRHKVEGNFEQADSIRDQLFQKGIKLLDRNDGKIEWQFRNHSR